MKQACSIPALVAALALSLSAGAASALVSPQDLTKPPQPKADQRVTYGADPSQVGDLWLPKGAGPHPVVVLIHGGCWLAKFGGLEGVALVADDLRNRGYVVWNLEYRRLGEVGAGYPGTFADVGHGVDRLRDLAKTYPIDLRHVVVVGHSAGGTLALWAAGRARLPKTSPLASADPLHVAGAVSLGGVDDLQSYRRSGPPLCGGPDTIDKLVGAAGRRGAAVYADTSPAAMVPLGVPQAVVSGDVDPIVPRTFGHAYAAKARAAGDKVQVLDNPGAGHFEMIDPRSPAWKAIVPVIAKLAH